MAFALVAVVAAAAGGFAYGLSRGGAGGNPARIAASSSAVVVRPCTLLTNAEASAALGVKIERRSTQLPGSVQPFQGFRMCTWIGARFASFGYEDNRVVIQTRSMSRARFANEEQQLAGGTQTVRRIPGLGEAAYETTGPYYSVNVYVRGTAITVTAYSSSSLKVEEHLARIAVARLP